MLAKSRAIKHISSLGFLALLLISCGTSSNAPKEASSDTVRLTFVESDHFDFGTKRYDVKKGENFSIRLAPKEGYTLSDCSYDDWDFNETSKILTLYDVKYPERIELEAKHNDVVIQYFINGGARKDGLQEEYYVESRLRDSHLRYNTSLGTEYISRDGYQLVGWSESKDGGDIIGLGSRITVPEGEIKQLYAVWDKVNELSDFTYEIKEDEVSLTSYSGINADSLVIPASYQNKPITSIKSGFMFNKSFKEVVLPETIKTISDGAFVKCNVDKINFFDSLSDVSDESFINTTIKKWHINAQEEPHLIGKINHAQFAEDIDRLILNQDKKKLLFFAGCSMSYGLQSWLVEKKYPDYFIQNLGVIGGTNASYQFDVISNYVGEGDIFIHAPEVSSSYQLMSDLSAEHRMFMMFEGNYDLFDLADVTKISGLWKEWKEFQEARREDPCVSYDTHLSDYNAYGDFSVARPMVEGKDQSYTKPAYGYDLSNCTSDAIANLGAAYKLIQDKGAKVVFSFSPVNQDGLTSDQSGSEAYLAFDYFYRSNLANYGVDTISHVRDYIYKGRYFYDEDYHLNDEGARLRTEQLMDDLAGTIVNN